MIVSTDSYTKQNETSHLQALFMCTTVPNNSINSKIFTVIEYKLWNVKYKKTTLVQHYKKKNEEKKNL